MGAALVAFGEFLMAAFSRLMASRLGSWIVQACAFLGIQFVANKFTSTVISSELASHFSGIGGDILAWLSFLNVDSAITVILSAYATVAATHWTMTRIGNK